MDYREAADELHAQWLNGNHSTVLQRLAELADTDPHAALAVVAWLAAELPWNKRGGLLRWLERYADARAERAQ
jgi:hypothetical protein